MDVERLWVLLALAATLSVVGCEVNDDSKQAELGKVCITAGGSWVRAVNKPTMECHIGEGENHVRSSGK
jgi:hypothetical protein